MWSQRPEFSLSQQSATLSQWLTHVKIYIQKHKQDYSSLFTSKTAKQSRAWRPAGGACLPPQTPSTVPWHRGKGLELVSKGKDPAGHAQHPRGWRCCRGSGAAIGGDGSSLPKSGQGHEGECGQGEVLKLVCRMQNRISWPGRQEGGLEGELWGKQGFLVNGEGFLLQTCRSFN